ncbi:MAG: anthranilate phosphoribosyltransferase [Flavobacteriaceae bacterium]
MKQYLEGLTQGETLTQQEAYQALKEIGTGQHEPVPIAAFLTVFMMRPIRPEELAGFREALLDLCIPIDLRAYAPMDLCGTGGDGKDTFNISTLSSVVCAGAGIKVAKHGNYGVSSGCGSSNVLEHLGVRFSNDSDFLERCIEQAGICVLHAPLFHPAMKEVAPIRKGLGLKTFFNMLGPLVNPARPEHQLVGVYDLALTRLYAHIFEQSETNYAIIHALDGYDEISLTGATKVVQARGESLLEPRTFGLEPLAPEAIGGGDSVEAAAKIFMKVLQGNGSTAQQQVVCANAGMAIATHQGISPQEGYAKAQESLSSGQALQAFQTLQEISR